jgi:hypothetical protein
MRRRKWIIKQINGVDYLYLGYETLDNSRTKVCKDNSQN